MREAPKVIFVGELRDRETTEIAITAAETGHLVVSTLHTINAGQSVNRILGMFEQAEQGQMRQRLAETLRYIVAQRLAPKIGGGRQLVMEIMGSNLRTREAVLLGENEERSFYDITAASATYGWQTFDQSIIASYKDDKIDEETALAYASRKPVVMRGVDQHKHGLNQAQEASGLRMAQTADDAPPPWRRPPPAPCLRFRWRNPDHSLSSFFIEPWQRLCVSRSHRAPPPAPAPRNHQEDRIGRDDRSALVCCHEPSYLEYLTGQLRGIGYKVHHATGHHAACSGWRRVPTT